VDGARAAYETIAEARPVGILTNGFVEVQSEKLKTFPVLEERAETVVVCEENGALKPDPAAFAHAAERAGIEASDILYVGDSYRSDVEGAQNAGWRVAWYAPNGTNDRSLGDRSFAFDNWTDLADRL